MSTIGRYDTVEIKEVREQAKMALLMQNDNSIDDELDFYITRGLGRMNALSALTKINCDIEVCGFTAKLPKGLVKLLAVRVPNSVTDNQSANNQYLYFYDKPFFTQNSQMVDDVSWYDFGNTMQINNGYLMFNLEQTVETMQISYIGSLTNECGDVLIYERYSDALAAFACYKFANSRLHLKTFMPTQVAEWKQEWVNQRGMIIAEDAKIKFKEQAQQIRAIMYTPYYQPFRIG
jgi:hypothetical protein